MKREEEIEDPSGCAGCEAPEPDHGMKPFRVVVRLLPRSGYYRDASASWACPGCGVYNRCHWWRDAMDSAYEHALTCEWLAALNDNPAKWADRRAGVPA